MTPGTGFAGTGVGELLGLGVGELLGLGVGELLGLGEGVGELEPVETIDAEDA